MEKKKKILYLFPYRGSYCMCWQQGGGGLKTKQREQKAHRQGTGLLEERKIK